MARTRLIRSSFSRLANRTSIKLVWLAMLALAVVIAAAGRGRPTQALFLKEPDPNGFALARTSGQVLGNGDVDVVMFSSFRCPWCRVQLLALDSVLDSGVVRSLRVHHLVGVGDTLHADWVHRAMCEAKWQEFVGVSMQAFAAAAGEVDWVRASSPTTVHSCPSLDDLNRTLHRAGRLAETLEITSTPVILVHGVRVTGAIDAQSLKELIAERGSRPVK